QPPPQAGRAQRGAGSPRRHHGLDVAPSRAAATAPDRTAEGGGCAPIHRLEHLAATTRPAAFPQTLLRAPAVTRPVNPPAGEGPAAQAAEGTPGIARRLASFVYEGVLLFGVVMIAGFLFSTLTQQRHALQGRHGLQ